jgi:pimeloyl-ACP methyl ester carboxylesterase
LIAGIAGLAAPAVFADPADAPATQPAEPQLSPQERAVKIQSEYKLLVQQMQGKDWTSALDSVNQLDTLAPHNGDILYNKACILARLGKKQDALDVLSKSIDAGFVDSDHIKSDDDLATLHDDPQFDPLVAKAAKAATDYSRFPYEKGEDMPDVKTVEADPPGGLRYRVRMSKDATAEHPDRLVIWFHPSGGSMDNTAESLAPLLAKHHLALVVFTQKGYMNWSSDDVTRMNKSFDSIAKIHGLNSKKPIALGFSAGGQMMLMMYELDPGQFGAMVLDAAYPVTIVPPNTIQIHKTPPANPAIKNTPILAFVGGDDGGSQVWKMVGDNWRNAGVPLTVNVIPNRRHEWLLDTDERQKALVDWLDEVNAGKLPGAAAAAPTTKPAIPDQQPG